MKYKKLIPTEDQMGVTFIKCEHPFTIDKSAEWGEGNVQEFPNGGYLRIVEGCVGWGVQPNADFTAPIGWVPNGKGTFDKLPIWVQDFIYKPTGFLPLLTKDGFISYEVKTPTVIVYNCKNNRPDWQDSWAMPFADLVKRYSYDTPLEEFEQ